MVVVAAAGCLVGVAGAMIDVAGTAGVVEEVDVGMQVVQLVNFGGVVVTRLVVLGVGAVAAAADVAAAEPAAGTASVKVTGVEQVAEGAKVVDIAVGAGNSSGVAEGFAVVAAEQELANGIAGTGTGAEVDTFVNMSMSVGVDDAAAALAKLWSVEVLGEEVGLAVVVAGEQYVGAVD